MQDEEKLVACGNIILSYAFKMRWGYLSTSYLEQNGLKHITCAPTTMGIHWVCIGNALNPAN